MQADADADADAENRHGTSSNDSETEYVAFLLNPLSNTLPTNPPKTIRRVFLAAAFVLPLLHYILPIL
jgi:hypothetical protein